MRDKGRDALESLDPKAEIWAKRLYQLLLSQDQFAALRAAEQIGLRRWGKPVETIATDGPASLHLAIVGLISQFREPAIPAETVENSDERQQA